MSPLCSACLRSQVWLQVDYGALLLTKLFIFLAQVMRSRLVNWRCGEAIFTIGYFVVALPFLLIWNIVGIVWYSQNKHCLTGRLAYWFGLWLFLGWGYILFLVRLTYVNYRLLVAMRELQQQNGMNLFDQVDRLRVRAR